ncbi:hypothetical protein L1987_02173 [Smallanthus sonchifolius]|uniref:Uncharacterized protein n=1 Tax=Smallanthus sonchifolius TaxID=185202 RepID=A0ACB9K6Z3_9ASTR|nr:hypothetical protein L1987_02173 [Smallanthus sonchifolius]
MMGNLRIVDFCCGSNDFSCFMKEKLDSMGKRCKFKNYDLITPKVVFVKVYKMVFIGSNFHKNSRDLRF